MPHKMLGQNGAYELAENEFDDAEEGEELEEGEEHEENDEAEDDAEEDDVEDDEEEEDEEDDDERAEEADDVEVTSAPTYAGPSGGPPHHHDTRPAPGVTVMTENRTRTRYMETRSKGVRIAGPQIGVKVRGSYVDRTYVRTAATRHLTELNPVRGPGAMALLLDIEALYVERGLLEPQIQPAGRVA
jgi:hypothetical protein